MLVPVSGTLSEVYKAVSVDPDAAEELIRFGLYEALCDLVDANARSIHRDLDSRVTKRSDELRRGLVRTYVDRRLTGEDIGDVVKAASALALVDSAVSKDLSPEDRAKLVANEPRGDDGRWTKLGSRVADVLGTLTESDPGLRTSGEKVGQQLTGDRYDRMRVVGNGLMLSSNQNMQAAGALTRVAAELGPEAERVLGPGMRRTAYRYRGTEKRPARELVGQTRQVKGMMRLQTDRSEGERFRSMHADQFVASRGGDPSAGVGGYYADRSQQSLSDDQKLMRAVGDTAANYLIGRGPGTEDSHIPSFDDASLSWEAGQTPPSVGVMIDRDGDVVSEAMGYNGDHYLPFDLRNLKRLHGGQYVRTRALGGPTSEDIYTGLMTGARQLQVVSNSGVFTVEFDPDLRGGRRYSDKARQMVDRYSRILDRIDQSGKGGDNTLYARDLDPEKKREIRTEITRAAIREGNVNEAVIRRRVENAETQARLEAQIGLDEDEMAEVADQRVATWAANQHGRNLSRDDLRRKRLEELDNLRESGQAATVRRLQLNGEGYERALRSLQREFPYYIRSVQFESLPKFLTDRKLHQPGSGPLPKRGAKEASRAHVSRGNLVPEKDAASRGINAAGQRTKVASGGGGTGAPAAGTAGTAGAVEPGAAKPPAKLSLDNDVVIQRIAPQFAVGIVAPRMEGITAPVDTSDRLMETPEQAMAVGQPDAFVAWLHNRANPMTHGNPAQVARYLLSDKADENVLRTAAEGYEQLAMHLAPLKGQVPQTSEQAEQAAATVRDIADVRFPFGEGSGAEYSPDFDDPRPGSFADIKALVGADDQAFTDFANKQASGKQGTIWDQAMSKLSGTDDDVEIADHIRQLVTTFKSRGSELEPEDRVEYKERLEQTQRVWAFLKAKRVTEQMRKLGGESGGPKALGQPEKPIEKRLRLVAPDSPVAKALARSLADRIQPRASSR